MRILDKEKLHDAGREYERLRGIITQIKHDIEEKKELLIYVQDYSHLGYSGPPLTVNVPWDLYGHLLEGQLPELEERLRVLESQLEAFLIDNEV